jgi:outer membrane protein TolC
MPQVKAFANRELYEDDLSALDPTWYVGVGLQWSIFDGLQRHKDMQKINIQKNIKELEKSHAEEQLNLNLAKSQEDLNTANKLLLLAREKRSDAMEGLEITMKGYQVGLNDITERLAAETDMQKAELELLQAIYQQRKASLKLIDATGQLSIENFTKEQ